MSGEPNMSFQTYALEPHDTTINSVLQAVVFALRSTHHTSIQSSPGQLVFGRDIIINATYIANWREIRQRQRKNVLYNNARENRNRISFDYQPGQFVYSVNKDIKRKLNPNKDGPYEIVGVHTNGTLTIRRSPTVLERVNIRRVHPVN